MKMRSTKIALKPTLKKSVYLHKKKLSPRKKLYYVFPIINHEISHVSSTEMLKWQFSI